MYHKTIYREREKERERKRERDRETETETETERETEMKMKCKQVNSNLNCLLSQKSDSLSCNILCIKHSLVDPFNNNTPGWYLVIQFVLGSGELESIPLTFKHSHKHIINNHNYFSSKEFRTS